MKAILIAACMAAVLCVLPVAPAGAGGDLPPQPRPGDIPPDVLGNDRDGNPVTVSQYRGQVVLVRSEERRVGTRVSVRVTLGGRRTIQTNKYHTTHKTQYQT